VRGKEGSVFPGLFVRPGKIMKEMIIMAQFILEKLGS
jgi:hypothetical protein